MTADPIISISLPLYNAAHELEARLDNVAAQTFGDFQVLMLDSASTDGTEAIGRRYAARDPRFQYVRSRQAMSYGPAVQQNIYRGLDSQYLILTSHSQRWAPTYLEECIKALDQYPQALAAYSWCQFLRENEHDPWPEDLPGGLHWDDFDLSDPDPARRFLSVVEHQKWYTPFFGLIRTETCLQGHLGPESLAHRHHMTAMLALKAPLIQIDQPLLFRRWQPLDSSYLSLYRHHLSQPMELKPAPLSDRFGYQVQFITTLRSLLGTVAGAPSLSSRQRETLAGQTAAAFIKRYRKELTAEMEAAIERVTNGWLYVWRAVPTAEITSKAPEPLSLLDEDDDQPPPRPNLDLSVARRVNERLGYYLNFFPTHPGLYYALGLTYRLLGRWAEAKTALTIELRNNPDYEPARQKLRAWEGT